MLDGQLPVKDTMTFDVERPWSKFDGAKATVIQEWFGESPSCHYARLNPRRVARRAGRARL